MNVEQKRKERRFISSGNWFLSTVKLQYISPLEKEEIDEGLGKRMFGKEVVWAHTDNCALLWINSLQVTVSCERTRSGFKDGTQKLKGRVLIYLQRRRVKGIRWCVKYLFTFSFPLRRSIFNRPGTIAPERSMKRSFTSKCQNNWHFSQ